MRMVAAVAPFIDAAISKTVNVPEDYPFADFKDLYFEAWKAGLEGHHDLPARTGCWAAVLVGRRDRTKRAAE